jgi:kynurenine formamidase
MNSLIDLSHPITDSMQIYPDDEPPHLEKFNDLELEGYNNYRFDTGMHVGTHIDGPLHMTPQGQFIDEIDINRFTGKGYLLHAKGEPVIQCKPVYDSKIENECIVVIYSGWSRMFGQENYYEDFPTLSIELAHLFVEKKIKMVCLDFPSPDRKPYPIHKLLFSNNILITENCTNVEKLMAIKEFEIIALPLCVHADSSPARVVARELHSSQS